MQLPLGEVLACLAPPTCPQLPLLPGESLFLSEPSPRAPLNLQIPPICHLTPPKSLHGTLCDSPFLLIFSQGCPLTIPSRQTDCRQHILGLILWTSGKNSHWCSPALHLACCSSEHNDRQKCSGENNFLVHFSFQFLDDLYLWSTANCSADCQKKTTPGHSFKGTFLFGLLFS